MTDRAPIPRRLAAPLALVVLAAALGAMPAASGPEPITAEPLTERHAFAGDVSIRITQALEGLPPHEVEIGDAAMLVVVKFTIQPGAVFSWHTHPGTVLVSLAEGELDFIFAADCSARRLAPGTAIVDPGNEVHTARNPGDSPAVVIATLLGAPAEGGLTLPVAAGQAADLDARCGFETPGGHRH